MSTARELTRRQPIGQTIANKAMDNLRAEILTGNLPPGARLRVSEVRHLLGVSVGVAREALMRLSEQDLVRSEDHRGFSVRPIKASELIQLTETRLLIEGEALRLAVDRADVHWQSEILALQHRLRNTTERSSSGHGVSVEWTKAHLEFHAALVAGCGNAVTAGICERLQQAAQIYPSWSVGASRGRDATSEHEKIVSAVVAADTYAAVNLYREHIQLTTEQLLDGLATGDIKESSPAT